MDTDYSNVTALAELANRQDLRHEQNQHLIQADQILYNLIVAIFGFFVSGLFGIRVTTFSLRGDKAYSLQRFLTATIYLISIGFVITGIVFLNVWNFDEPALCNDSIRICISFYVVSKKLWYLFLLERAYLSSTTIASERPPRYRSPIFVIGVLALVIGFTLIDTMTFTHPLGSPSPITQNCRVLVPRPVSMSLLAFDLTVHLGLTGVYFYKSWTSFSGMRIRALLPYMKLAIYHRVPDCPNGVLMVLMARSILGLFLAILPTIINMITLAFVNGKEMVWICWIVLTTDACFGAIIFHWLTSMPEERGEGTSRNQLETHHHKRTPTTVYIAGRYAEVLV